MLAALEFREAALASGRQGICRGYRENFEQDLLRRLPGTIIVGKDEDRLWNTVSAIMPQSDYQQRWVVKLDKLGFAVSTGSACASGREEPSHVLAAMGYNDSQTGRVLRFSSGWETPQEDWPALLEALVRVYRGMTKTE
jgi:cysteine desulfurase